MRPQSPPTQWHTSSNKATPTLTGPQVLIVPLPMSLWEPITFKLPQWPSRKLTVILTLTANPISNPNILYVALTISGLLANLSLALTPSFYDRRCVFVPVLFLSPDDT